MEFASFFMVMHINKRRWFMTEIAFDASLVDCVSVWVLSDYLPHFIKCDLSRLHDLCERCKRQREKGKKTEQEFFQFLPQATNSNIFYHRHRSIQPIQFVKYKNTHSNKAHKHSITHTFSVFQYLSYILYTDVWMCVCSVIWGEGLVRQIKYCCTKTQRHNEKILPETIESWLLLSDCIRSECFGPLSFIWRCFIAILQQFGCLIAKSMGFNIRLNGPNPTQLEFASRKQKHIVHTIYIEE